MKQLILMQILLKSIIFKFLIYKTMLSESTDADGDNGILKNPTTTAPLKYLSNFWRSLIN